MRGVRRGGHGIRVEDGGDGGHAVNETRSGAHDQAVGVDGPDREARQRLRDQPGLVDRTRQVVAAGGHDDDVRVGGGDVGPGHRDRADSGAVGDGLVADGSSETRRTEPA